MSSHSIKTIESTPYSKMWKLNSFQSRHKCGGGQGGGSPGEQGAGRVTGDGRRKGGRRDFYDGGKRERNSKRQAFAICYCLLPVKEKNPRMFLDFHLTFSVAYSKILYTRKVKKRKFVLGIKKRKRHYFL